MIQEGRFVGGIPDLSEMISQPKCETRAYACGLTKGDAEKVRDFFVRETHLDGTGTCFLTSRLS